MSLAQVPAAELEVLLAPALELAVLVARMSLEAVPPQPVPPELRPLARFTRLSSSGRSRVRRVLEADGPFREKVAVGADAAQLPRPAWLFLRRPDGWEDELASLASAQQQAQGQGRAVERKLARLEVERERLEADLRAARAAVVETRRNLDRAEAKSRNQEERLAALERKVTSLTGERDSARRSAERQAQRAAAAEQALAAPRAEHTETAAVGDVLPTAAHGAGGDLLAQANQEAKEALALRDEALERLAEAGRLVQAAAEGLATSLFDVARSLVPPERSGSMAEPAPDGKDHLPRQQPSGRDRRRRTPRRLPPAIYDDSAEAAVFLARVPRMLFLVDGYNATLATWPDVPIATQRARLITACQELHARFGTEVLIVFDGAEVAPAPPPLDGRRGVRWRFSPVDVEADDVLLELVDELPEERAVTVASSDRRVFDGARRLGANVISTPQLLAVLRRDPGSR